MCLQRKDILYLVKRRRSIGLTENPTPPPSPEAISTFSYLDLSWSLNNTTNRRRTGRRVVIDGATYRRIETRHNFMNQGHPVVETLFLRVHPALNLPDPENATLSVHHEAEIVTVSTDSSSNSSVVE